DVMLQYGALAIVSLDGLMQVQFPCEAPITVGQKVSVHTSDGMEYPGKIAGSLEGTLTVTLTDDGPLYGDTAVVSLEDGTVLGSGALDVHSPWRALASSGTVSSVSARPERKVYNGATLFTLKDLSNDPASLKLSALNREYSEMMQELFLLYQDGTVNAPCDGYVTGIDKTMAKALAAANQQHTVKLLADKDPEETEKDYSYYVGLVTEVKDSSLTVTMPPFSVPGPEEAAMMSALAMANSLVNFQNSVTITRPESLEEDVVPGSVYVFKYRNNEEDETSTLEKMLFVTTLKPDAGGGDTPIIPVPVIPDISGLINGLGGNTGNAAAQQEENLFPLAGTKVCTVTPTDIMTVTISVDELDILQYALGMEADISVDALPGRAYTGTVTAIGGVGTNEGGNSKFDVELTLDREADMLNGMNASVVVHKSTETALLIPVAALNDSGGRSTVYTAYDPKNGQLLNPAAVTTGISDGEMVQILSGLEEGQTVWYSYYGGTE
ncbi:MAG: HlyD family efflux transporter periplasmic adaptor subunit, partial [Oscillospiraceae bacterium]|nr:HlyD family efflux transporter periplasmic adaptor subunit [Oscillospiraceae bacterium]